MGQKQASASEPNGAFFRGIARLSVDAKGRFALPKARREQLDTLGVEQLVITADPSRCLLLYPMAAWRGIEAQLVALPNTHATSRAYQRLYLGYATEVEFDGTGRLLLPSELREYSGIDRQAVLIGQGQKYELWSAERFDEQSAMWADDINAIDPAVLPEAMKDLSI